MSEIKKLSYAQVLKITSKVKVINYPICYECKRNIYPGHDSTIYGSFGMVHLNCSYELMRKQFKEFNKISDFDLIVMALKQYIRENNIRGISKEQQFRTWDCWDYTSLSCKSRENVFNSCYSIVKLEKN